MPTAFGRAMLQELAQPGQMYQLTVDGHRLTMPCADFLRLRREEETLLAPIVGTLRQGARVLDYGCGAGRHLKHLRAKRADVQLVGIEMCDGLRAHCTAAVAAPAAFVADWAGATGQGLFDLILLMGNGLGILGEEHAAREGLNQLVDALKEGGRIVLETGPRHLRGYHTATLQTGYLDQADAPIVWGGAGQDWVKDVFQELGCEVAVQPSGMPAFFFAVAHRP